MFTGVRRQFHRVLFFFLVFSSLVFAQYQFTTLNAEAIAQPQSGEPVVFNSYLPPSGTSEGDFGSYLAYSSIRKLLLQAGVSGSDCQDPNLLADKIQKIVEQGVPNQCSGALVRKNAFCDPNVCNACNNLDTLSSTLASECGQRSSVSPLEKAALYAALPSCGSVFDANKDSFAGACAQANAQAAKQCDQATAIGDCVSQLSGFCAPPLTAPSEATYLSSSCPSPDSWAQPNEACANLGGTPTPKSIGGCTYYQCVFPSGQQGNAIPQSFVSCGVPPAPQSTLELAGAPILCQNDGVCHSDRGENYLNCPLDCPSSPQQGGPFFGDGKCNEVVNGVLKTCSNDALDCGKCPGTCGNGVCEPQYGKSCLTCPADCGACVPDKNGNKLTAPACVGDGVCHQELGEDCNTCPSDCGACATPTPTPTVSATSTPTPAPAVATDCIASDGSCTSAASCDACTAAGGTCSADCLGASNNCVEGSSISSQTCNTATSCTACQAANGVCHSCSPTPTPSVSPSPSPGTSPAPTPVPTDCISKDGVCSTASSCGACTAAGGTCTPDCLGPTNNCKLGNALTGESCSTKSSCTSCAAANGQCGPCIPTPTPTPSPSPTASATPTPTPTASATPVPSTTPIPTPVPGACYYCQGGSSIGQSTCLYSVGSPKLILVGGTLCNYVKDSGTHCTLVKTSQPYCISNPNICGTGSCTGTVNGQPKTCSNCPQDCGVCHSVCGNGICESGETCSSCPQDCGSCTPPPVITPTPAPSVCGDGICDGSENQYNCPQDCSFCQGGGGVGSGGPSSCSISSSAVNVGDQLNALAVAATGSIVGIPGPGSSFNKPDGSNFADSSKQYLKCYLSGVQVGGSASSSPCIPTPTSNVEPLATFTVTSTSSDFNGCFNGFTAHPEISSLPSSQTCIFTNCELSTSPATNVAVAPSGSEKLAPTGKLLFQDLGSFVTGIANAITNLGSSITSPTPVPAAPSTSKLGIAAQLPSSTSVTSTGCTSSSTCPPGAKCAALPSQCPQGSYCLRTARTNPDGSLTYVGTCQTYTTPSSAPAPLPPSPLPIPQTCSSCGNGVCDAGKTCSSCPQDCGPCPSATPTPAPITCPPTSNPVCGTNGQPYNNGCLALAAGVSVSPSTSCLPTPIPSTPPGTTPPGTTPPGGSGGGPGGVPGTNPGGNYCNYDSGFSPVCGSDGNTYGNSGQASCAGVGNNGNGNCPPPTSCPPLEASLGLCNPPAPSPGTGPNGGPTIGPGGKPPGGSPGTTPTPSGGGGGGGSCSLAGSCNCQIYSCDCDPSLKTACAAVEPNVNLPTSLNSPDCGCSATCADAQSQVSPWNGVSCTRTPTPTPSASPSATASASPNSCPPCDTNFVCDSSTNTCVRSTPTPTPTATPNCPSGTFWNGAICSIGTPTPSPSVSQTPSPSVTVTPSPSVSQTPSPSVTVTPSPSVSQTPSPSGGFAGLPATGFVAASQAAGATPQIVCEQLWAANPNVLLSQCTVAQQAGGFIDNPWNAKPKDFCSKQAFTTACQSSYVSMIDRSLQRNSAIASVDCELEASLNTQYMQDLCVKPGACQQHFNGACSEATTQYNSCMGVFSRKDYVAIAKAFCLDASNYGAVAQISTADVQQPAALLPADVVVRKSADAAVNDLNKLELSVVARKINQPYGLGGFDFYNVLVPGQDSGQLRALQPVVDSGLDYASIAFASQPELQAPRASLASDALTSTFVDPSRGGSYGQANYLGFKKELIAQGAQLKKVDDSELNKDLYYKLTLLLAGNQQEGQEAAQLRQVATAMSQLSGELGNTAAGSGDLVSIARFNSLADKTRQLAGQINSEACRKEKISNGFVPWFAQWTATLGGLIGGNC